MIQIKNLDIKRIKYVKFVPPIISVVLILSSSLIFADNPGFLGNIIVISIIIGVVPFVFATYFEYKKIKAMEDELPVFLLDLSEAQKTGMTLVEGMKNLAKIDYGNLTPEVKKINDQLSWGFPLQEVLGNAAQRLSKSKLIDRTLRIINEAYTSGGDIARTMEATASDIIAVKEAEKERKAVTNQHVFVMYGIYFIFIGIVIGLAQTLIPILELNTESSLIGGAFGFQDPCNLCKDNPSILCINCTVLQTTCTLFSLKGGARCYYNALFLMMAIIQGIFSGLVAGQIGEGNIIAGVKHSVIMTSGGFSILMFLFFTGVL